MKCECGGILVQVTGAERLPEKIYICCECGKRVKEDGK